LPRLRNPTNDARAVAAIFQKMGYRTQLLLDATEQNIRTEVRKFANESEKVDTAIVFYAGHGAQVNGSNYLLPVDIDVPRTDADIQFTGLKVDDLVNSIRSSTKIVFLDACRDNPVLFKNIVSGRGGHPIGLAPASGSNFDQKPGGGVFIAYATDAGSVADDGQAQHSPFTQALLRNLQKPMSIDDMFSLVTKEVRLVTKNAQRPYKYASLENIICVAPCSNSSTVTTTDVFQEAKQSESDELQIALQTKNIDALETYLQKYPDSPKRVEIDNAMDELKRSEFTEWTLYANGLHNEHWYMQISSIQQYGDKVAVKIKAQLDPSRPKIVFGKSFPNAEYFEDLTVFDCKRPKFGASEETILDKSDAVLYHYKFADPQYLDLSKGQEVGPTSIASVGRNIVCHPEMRTPIAKVRLTKMDFKSLGSTSAGDGTLFYEPLQSSSGNSNQKELLFIMSFFDDKTIPLAPNSTVKDPPQYRTEVDNVRLLCAEGRLLAVRNEYFDASNNLVHLGLTDPLAPIKDWIEIKLDNLSPLSTLHRIFCGEEFGGIGVQIRIDDSAVKVGKVIEDTPAAMAGIKENDIITHLDNQPLAGLTLGQVVEKIRGPANSKIALKILRSGQDSPLDLVVSREVIRSQPVQEQVTK
jgi:Caspase domain/PDZ domain